MEKYPSCALCKVSDKSLLIASHIKPWKNNEADEKQILTTVLFFAQIMTDYLIRGLFHLMTVDRLWLVFTRTKLYYDKVILCLEL